MRSWKKKEMEEYNTEQYTARDFEKGAEREREGMRIKYCSMYEGHK